MIYNRNIPIAEIRPIHSAPVSARPTGLAKDEFEIPSTFFSPLSDEFDNYFVSKK